MKIAIYDLDKTLINFYSGGTFKKMPQDQYPDAIVRFNELRNLIAKQLQEGWNIAIATKGYNQARAVKVLESLNVPRSRYTVQAFNSEDPNLGMLLTPVGVAQFKKSLRIDPYWGNDCLNCFEGVLPKDYLQQLGQARKHWIAGGKNIHIANIIIQHNRQHPEDPVTEITFVDDDYNNREATEKHFAEFTGLFKEPYRSWLKAVKITVIETEPSSGDFIKKIEKSVPSNTHCNIQTAEFNLPALLRIYKTTLLRNAYLVREHIEQWETLSTYLNNNIRKNILAEFKEFLSQPFTPILDLPPITLMEEEECFIILLSLAIQKHDNKFVKQLLDYREKNNLDFDLDHRLELNNLIHTATASLNATALELLVNAGMDINTKNDIQKTALHLICEMLIEPENSNSSSEEENNEPYIRNIKECEQVIETLLSLGADRTIKDSRERTPNLPEKFTPNEGTKNVGQSPYLIYNQFQETGSLPPSTHFNPLSDGFMQ